MEKKKVAVFLVNGFEEIEAVTPIDLLQRAGINVDTVSITKDNLVESARRMKILADKIIDDIDFSEYDMLILPGGPGVGNYFNSQTLLDNVLKFSKDNENKKLQQYARHLRYYLALEFWKGKMQCVFQRAKMNW